MLNLQVGASADDADETSSGSVALTDNNIWIATSDHWGGFRFQNVTVPQGATINSAIFQVYIITTTYDDVEIDVYCEDADDSAQFTTDDYNISSRDRTSAKTNKSQASAGEGWYSIDITSAVQEVIDRDLWSSGNSMSVIVDGLSGVDVKFRAYDGDTGLAAKLDINHAEAGQPISLRGTAVPRMRQWHPGRL